MMYGSVFGTPINLTSSGALTSKQGALLGYHVNSVSGGTIVLRDGGSGGTAMAGTITPAVGYMPFPAMGVSASGLYATLSGTIDVTFFVMNQA